MIIDGGPGAAKVLIEIRICTIREWHENRENCLVECGILCKLRSGVRNLVDNAGPLVGEIGIQILERQLVNMEIAWRSRLKTSKQHMRADRRLEIIAITEPLPFSYLPPRE